MMTMIKILTISTLFYTTQSLNPVKTSILLLGMASAMFLYMTTMSGQTWFPLIFYLLFMGGILIVFMIMSSVMPNEKMKKVKYNKMLIISSIAISMIVMSAMIDTGSSSMELKWFLHSENNMILMIALILSYFLMFIKILTKEKASLRSELCYNKKNFVNFLVNKMAMKLIRKEQSLVYIVNNSLWDLPSPSTMTYFWNFGSVLGVCLLTQIISGLLLTFHYTSYSPESFYSVVKIMQEVWSGWIIRLIHMNGASVFFFFIYLHLYRGLFFFSSVHKNVWNSGVSIMIILMAISFLGYVLPWGQMSYWAVAVITNLFSVVPMIGVELVKWIWGGFSVSAPTLTRFYSLHFLLPFVLTFLVIIHLFFLHKEGSSNSLGLNSNIDKVEFHPYFSIKDVTFLMAVLILSVMISFYFPYILGDPVNNVPANAMQTPVHIQPEWYFLPSYAILRALPNKTAGVIALALSVSIFYLLPLFNFKFSTKFSSQRYFLYWTMAAMFMFLMKMGALPAEEPYVLLSKVGSVIYFSAILMINL